MRLEYTITREEVEEARFNNTTNKVKIITLDTLTAIRLGLVGIFCNTGNECPLNLSTPNKPFPSFLSLYSLHNHKSCVQRCWAKNKYVSREKGIKVGVTNNRKRIKHSKRRKKWRWNRELRNQWRI